VRALAILLLLAAACAPATAAQVALQPDPTTPVREEATCPLDKAAGEVVTAGVDGETLVFFDLEPERARVVTCSARDVTVRDVELGDYRPIAHGGLKEGRVLLALAPPPDARGVGPFWQPLAALTLGALELRELPAAIALRGADGRWVNTARWAAPLPDYEPMGCVFMAPLPYSEWGSGVTEAPECRSVVSGSVGDEEVLSTFCPGLSPPPHDLVVPPPEDLVIRARALPRY
jgi:hypothetical protein